MVFIKELPRPTMLTFALSNDPSFEYDSTVRDWFLSDSSWSSALYSQQCWQRSFVNCKETVDKANTHSGLIWEQFFVKSRLWVKLFSKGRTLDEFYVPLFSIIFLVYHLNPCCCSPFLITSVERKQFRIGELFLRKPDLCKVQ